MCGIFSSTLQGELIILGRRIVRFLCVTVKCTFCVIRLERHTHHFFLFLLEQFSLAKTMIFPPSLHSVLAEDRWQDMRVINVSNSAGNCDHIPVWRHCAPSVEISVIFHVTYVHLEATKVLWVREKKREKFKRTRLNAHKLYYGEEDTHTPRLMVIPPFVRLFGKRFSQIFFLRERCQPWVFPKRGGQGEKSPHVNKYEKKNLCWNFLTVTFG